MNKSESSIFLHGSTWVRADLHLHTKADKEFKYSGEANYYTSAYVNALEKAGVRLGIITNHNKFDMEEYRALRSADKKKEIGLLPGVELSVNDGANGIHTLVIFSDKWLEEGKDYINQFLNVAFEGKAPSEYEQENGRSSLSLLETIKKLEGYHRDFFLVFAHVEQNSGLWLELDGGRITDLGANEMFQRRALGFQKVRTHDGAGKRKATSREEIQRMFQSASLVHADETPVDGVGAGDVDMAYFEKFFESEYGEKLDAQKVPLPQLLENMNLAKAGTLNLAGTILFAKKPEVRLPAFVVKAVSFAGNDIAGENYLDSRDITGRVADMFQQCVGFVLANTSKPQGDQSVNSTGEFEIPRIVWEELIANALIHRNYFVSAPIRLLVFSDRVEIISPGHLPNNLTIANVKAGNSNIRNPILASFAAKLLPYRGLGSGVLRAIKAYPDIELIDDRDGNLFRAVICRRQP